MSREKIGFAREETSIEADRVRFGERLREAREYVGMTQDEVAKHLGIPRTALSNIEAGGRRVDALELRSLARLYQRPASWFTEEEDVSAAPELPRGVAHLAKAAAALSSRDREELARFADFLKARARVKAGDADG